MRFGDLVRGLRAKKGLKLREFCRERDIDPSNWSKIERGINPPPGDPKILNRWARFFDLSGEELQSFLDAAAIARNEIPQDLVADDRLAARLPVFFQAARKGRLGKEETAKLLADLHELDDSD